MQTPCLSASVSPLVWRAADPGWLAQYDYKDNFFGGTHPLSEKIGYPLVILLAALFTVITVTLVQIDKRWGGTK